MRKQKGFSIIDTLVTIALIILVIVLIFILFYFAGKESRDVKRISDVDVLRSTMARVKVQTGSFAEVACAAGAVYDCRGGLFERVLPTVRNFRDPRGEVLCVNNCTESCQYSFSESPTVNNYEVLFFLETGVGNYPEKGCYKLTQDGIEKR